MELICKKLKKMKPKPMPPPKDPDLYVANAERLVGEEFGKYVYPAVHE